METVKLTTSRIELPKLDSFICKNIPAGFNLREKPHKYTAGARLDELRCHISLGRGELSLGTLGGGNHFIEVDRDDEGALYLIVHTGSRNPGFRVARYYQDAAFKAPGRPESVPFELAYCEGELLENYLHDMAIMQEFAALNRRAIADEIIKCCKLREEGRFSTIHNYIDMEYGILRKGAVSARAGETLLIPINMRDGALRLMSRSEAKSSFTLSA